MGRPPNAAEQRIGSAIKLFLKQLAPEPTGVAIEARDPIRGDPQDVTLARATGGSYTNNHRRPIICVISYTHTVAVAGAFLLTQLNIGALGVSWGGWTNTPAIGIIKYSTMVAIIPSGETYGVTENAAGGNNTLLRWIEYQM